MPLDLKSGVWRRGDLWWLLALPVYQTIGTIRHEASHVLAAHWEGARIVDFIYWPTWRGGLYFGYASWVGRTDWLVAAAPYLFDLLTFVFGYLLCQLRLPRWLWINCFILGVISPFVNSGYRYVSDFWRVGDLDKIHGAVAEWSIQLYFLLTLALYVVAIIKLRPPTERNV